MRWGRGGRWWRVKMTPLSLERSGYDIGGHPPESCRGDRDVCPVGQDNKVGGTLRHKYPLPSSQPCRRVNAVVCVKYTNNVYNISCTLAPPLFEPHHILCQVRRARTPCFTRTLSLFHQEQHSSYKSGLRGFKSSFCLQIAV